MFCNSKKKTYNFMVCLDGEKRRVEGRDRSAFDKLYLLFDLVCRLSSLHKPLVIEPQNVWSPHSVVILVLLKSSYLHKIRYVNSLCSQKINKIKEKMPSVNSREKNKKKRKFIFFFFLLAFSLFSLFLATICIVKGSYRCPWEFGA